VAPTERWLSVVTDKLERDMSFVAQASEDADLFNLHCAETAAFPVLMESVAAHPHTGRYDLLFALDAELPPGDPFAQLDALLPTPVSAPADLPFLGGWVFLIGYEALRFVEPRVPCHPLRAGAAPAALILRCRRALVRDRLARRVYAVSELGAEDAATLLRQALQAPQAPPSTAPPAEQLSVEPGGGYEDGVRQVQRYLAAGDVFQVNLSRAWRARLRAGEDARSAYAALRAANPAPFAASWQGSGWAVLSSSPERLAAIHQGRVQTRPIAGTRARGATQAEDEEARKALLASAKDRAEHIMLIDLERNDLGRVCQPGSVRVSELMSLESYTHVHHLVSNVEGRLRAGVGPGSVLRAVFPGGTITGCPKVRCMEIIQELETGPRGAYTGTLGYLSRCGRLDSNILIRSLSVEGRDIHFRTGGGIVADSDPALELAETEAKARGLCLALTGSLP
jgi:anthranilate synthase component I